MTSVKLLSSFLLLSLQLLLLSLISFHPKQTSSSTTDNHHYNTDLESLLSFKEHVTDPSSILAVNWTTNTSFCNWIGIRCGRLHRRVVSLQLYGFSLQGNISPYLGNLSFLHVLGLGNNTLTGPIPESLGWLPRLQLINLERNHLSGPIPHSLFNTSSLLSIYLAANNLTASFPSNRSLIMHPRLHIIAVGGNQLTGQIPSIFASCFNLQILDLPGNKFTGTIPIELGSLAKLKYLSLELNNLGGTIPTSLGNLTKLQGLYLNLNHLEGAIPETLGNLQNLQELYLHRNRFTGLIPSTLFNASMLQVVSLSFNNLSGSIPVTLGKSMPQLTRLFMASNWLTGGLDFFTSLSNCKNLWELDVSDNKLEGVISDSVCNLSVKLQYFNVAYNHIGGNIPAGLGNLSSLYFIDLRATKLFGAIPVALTRLQKLQEFFLGSNSISGSIPLELGSMTSLVSLDLSMNLLSGPIPDSVGNLSMLRYLYLYHNTLSSSIPTSMWSLSSLIDLFLNQNNLNGIIPIQVGNMKALATLDIHMNHLSGNLSTAFGELQMLTHLDLSCNSFQGQIPESVGRLINFEYLNLSHNSLSNVIPKSLASLRYLTTLDLSFNRLEGQIPTGRVFSNLSIPFLESNLGLCGAPKLSFPPCSMTTNTSDSKSHLLIYTLPSIASFLVILASLYLLLTFCRRSRAKAPTDHNHGVDALRSNEYSRISYDELVRATDNFSDANLLGKGGFGSVFKACLDNGLVVAAKVFNSEVQEAFRSFDAECQVLRMVRHRNLVKVISACSNANFKALIFPFMVNGSLEKWLYLDGCYLSLHQRLNIMVDVSLALEYLHHYHDNVVLHCDLKPSNVLLDENMVAHVADFGIAKLLLCDDSKSTVLTKTTGTIGYMAPEYGSSGKVTRKGDVYSFGIMLLEAFTRKAPTNAMFNEELSLRQWVGNAHHAAVLEIVDSDLFRDDSFNQQGGEVLTSVQQTLSSVIELALLCSKELPTERISMKDVVPKLLNLRKEYLAKCLGSLTNT